MPVAAELLAEKYMVEACGGKRFLEQWSRKVRKSLAVRRNPDINKR
jgi:hypothetical protein